MIARYGVSVVSVTAALISSRWLEIHLATAPVSLFLCAVMFSAWFGGLRPGLLATALSILAFEYYFVAPVHSLAPDIAEIPRLLIFALSALFVGSLSAAQRRATESLRRARDELDGTVQELKRINEALHAENAERNRAEEQLQRSEAFLAEGQRISHTGSWGWNISSGKLVWSEEHYRIFGFDPGSPKPTYRLFMERIHVEDRLLFEQILDRAIRERSDFDHECRIVLPDGSIKYIRTVGHPVVNESGNPGEYIGTVMDVTEHHQARCTLEKAFEEVKKLNAELRRTNEELRTEIKERQHAEEALRESEERLQDIVDNTTAVVFVKDLELRYILINREYERRFQVQRDQIRGKTDFDIHSHDIAQMVRGSDRQVIEAGLPLQFEEVAPSIEGKRYYVVVKFLLRDRDGKPYGVCGIATDITESKRAQEMQEAVAREKEMFALQRVAELGRANEALRGCLDALASVPELDDFLGQVMAAMTRQLGALSSTLRVRNFEQNTLPLEIVFQDGRVMSPAEAKYPEGWRNVSIDEQRFVLFLDQPTTITSTLDPHSPMPEDQRSYLLGLGIKTIVIIPLTSGGQLNGRLTFRFTEERDFRPEELEIARALATQASLAIQLTRLAKNARQSAVLEERNQLAGEIHDSLAQFFTGISMQLGAAREVIQTGGDNGLSYIERATELAQFGLAEARRSAFSLHPSFIEESGLIETLRKLVERSNIPGRLRCNFHADGVPEKNVLPTVRQDLLRIAQEAISNAVRHAKPTVISVNVRWDPPNLVLEVTDNGSGIANAKLANGDGFGLSNMRARAENLGAQFDVRTAADRGTSIVVLVPINL
jgi:PAS domain S-box-containing protein